MASSSILLATKKKKKKSSLKELKTLGEQLLSSRAHINNLPRLLSFISPSSPPQHLLESILTLQSFFTPLLPDLPSSSSSSSTKSSSLVVVDAGGGDGDSSKNPEFVYKMWLRSKFDEFVKSLISIAVSSQSDESLRDVALDSIMEFVKLGKGGRFQSVIYHRLLLAIVHSSSSTVDFLLELLASKFFKYIDVRYFTYITLEKLARSLESTKIKDGINMSVHDSDEHISMSSDVELAVHRIHYLLSHIPPLEIQEGKSVYEMWSALGFLSNEDDGKGSMKGKHEGKQGKSKNSDNAVLSTSRIAKKMKLKFTKTWLSFLRLPLPLDLYKEVLVALHEAVIPYFSNPIMLCDFLTRSYDIGGVISVMALSSLFILMTQHGLEYPNFYEKLYVLLVPSIFLAKHRAKFFQLLDSCLKSPLLPAYLAAAFAKKLSRMALVVPPSGSLVIIALIHNLLRRHPSINCLVNQQPEDRTDGDVSGGQGDFVESAKESGSGLNASGEKPGIDASSDKPGIDLFKNEENDPLKSNAMRSSLWEIDTLRNHYCPAVSRFVLSLENDLTVRAKTTEITVKDFSSGSYATIFREEIGRRIKQVPLAFYTNNAIPTSLFSESDFAGWTFKYEETKTAESGNAENGVSTISEEENQKSAKKQRIKSS